MSDIYSLHSSEYAAAFEALEREFGARCYLYTSYCPVQVIIVLADSRLIYWRERGSWSAHWAHRIEGGQRFEVEWDRMIAEGDDYDDIPFGGCSGASFLAIARKLLGLFAESAVSP